MSTNFTIGDETKTVLEDLMPVFGVDSCAKVLQRAIGLARMAARYTDKNGVITISNESRKIDILMRDHEYVLKGEK